MVEKSKPFDDKFLSPFYCKVCNFDGKSTEDSATHVKSRDHAERVRILASCKTLVLWDINSCPVPHGCDASLVFRSIQRELEKVGFSGGELTITAIGDLEPILKQTPEVLPAINSSGILVEHDEGGFGFLGQFVEWMSGNPAPATIMLITTATNYFSAEPGIRGYTLVFYTALPELCDVEWQPVNRWIRGTGESRESFEDLCNRLQRRRPKSSFPFPTVVWWDINSCPVPDGCDASLVFRSIQWQLEKSGFSGGALTITAIGDLEPILKEIPEVLPALSSTGVLLKHLPRGLDPWGELVNWAFADETSAKVVLISSRVKTDTGCTRIIEDKGHTIVLYPALTLIESNWQPAKAWFTVNVESAWCCILCRYNLQLFVAGSFHGKSVQDFTQHLESRGHEQSLEMSDTPPTPSRKMQLSCVQPNGATCMLETLLFWDIDSCQVPHPDDARLVVGSINRALKKTCFSGVPLTITAIGNLNSTLNQAPGVLPALATAGVLLKHLPRGGEFFLADLVQFTLDDPPPANIIILISSDFHEHLLRGFEALKERGYIVKVDSGVPLLQCLLKDGDADAMASGSADNKQDTCSETVKSALSDCDGKNFGVDRSCY